MPLSTQEYVRKERADAVGLLTGVGDVVLVDAGSGIGVRQNEMGGMTRGADGGDGQTLLI